jgi:hypothetical protein
LLGHWSPLIVSRNRSTPRENRALARVRTLIFREYRMGARFACLADVEDREQVDRIIRAIDEILKESERVRGQADHLLRNRPVWPERRHPKHSHHPSGSKVDTE